MAKEIEIKWSIEDLKSQIAGRVCSALNLEASDVRFSETHENEMEEILDAIQDSHDANIGINWFVLDSNVPEDLEKSVQEYNMKPVDALSTPFSEERRHEALFAQIKEFIIANGENEFFSELQQVFAKAAQDSNGDLPEAWRCVDIANAVNAIKELTES